MKILVLNPHVDAERKIFAALRTEGHAVLMASSSAEAWQILAFHGRSVALAIVHREGAAGENNDAGLELLRKCRADSQQRDLPFIVTSEFWEDSKFAEHQGTPLGANAYLQYPCTPDGVVAMIRAVFGELTLGTALPSVPSPPNIMGIPALPPDAEAVILEDVSILFARPEGTRAGIVLEAPEQVEDDTARQKKASLLPPEKPPQKEFVMEQTRPTELPTLAGKLENPSAKASGPKSTPSPGVGLTIDFEQSKSLEFESPAMVANQTASVLIEGGRELGGLIESPAALKAEISSSREDLEDNPAPPDPTLPKLVSEREVGPPSANFGDLTSPLAHELPSLPGIHPPQGPSVFAEAPELPAPPPLPGVAPGSDATYELHLGESLGVAPGEPPSTDLAAPPAPIFPPEEDQVWQTRIQQAPPRAPKPEPTAVSSEKGRFPARPSSIAAPTAPNEPIPHEEEVLAREMPYLFGKDGTRGTASALDPSPLPAESSPEPSVSSLFVRPLGDAVVPGGAAQSPDLETLKRYLLLREQDVAALSTQLKGAREQVAAVEDALRTEKARAAELKHTLEARERRIADFEKEKEIAGESLQNEITDLKFQLRVKNDRARTLELQIREATDEMERLKDRVRSDIRKIRVREKELENRLEIMKHDSEALISARENKIIELKRKMDLLEFNMDLLQDQYSREKENSARLKERLARALQAVRVAGGLLNSKESGTIEDGESDEQSEAS